MNARIACLEYGNYALSFGLVMEKNRLAF